MNISERIAEVRHGFRRAFWVANTLELFERLAFYGSKAILAVYLAEKVGLGATTGAALVGMFSGVLYSLPVVAGTIVDRYGFRKSLASCFALFALGYFLIGLAGLEAGRPLVDAVGKTPYVVTVLLITAIGGSLIKPCIVGTVASTSDDKTRSLGYSIYYTLVNFGGALGPALALQVREHAGIEYVLVMSSVTSAAMFVATLLFFDEPIVAKAEDKRTLARVFGEMTMVFTNLRFMLLLVIFSGFYIMFWQIFYSLPFYAKKVLHFEQFELLEIVAPTVIILLTVPASALVKNWKPVTAVALGLGISSCSWLLIPLAPSVRMTAAAIAMFSVGESTLAPRFYEYVASLAPQRQVGTYMGFAFIPVSIGSFAAGPLAGWLVSHYMEDGGNPNMVWYILAGIGGVSTVAMLLYNQALSRSAGMSMPSPGASGTVQ